MRAAVCRAFNQPLVIEELSVAAPQKGEVRVNIAACAICHSDIHAIDGAWDDRLPSVYGHEAAGVVAEIGPGVERFALGDHVLVTLLQHCGHCFYCARNEHPLCEHDFFTASQKRLRDSTGASVYQGIKTAAFAEQVLVDQSQLIGIPADLPFPSASVLACGVITGYGAVVNTAVVTAGDSVVVIGTGGVGLNSIQGAAAVGASPIIALDLSDRKLAAARQFGATHAINPTRSSSEQQVRELTGQRKADYVFVTVGSIEAIEQGVLLMRKGGTLVIVGMPPEGAMVRFEALTCASDSLRILGSKMGSTVLARDVPPLIQRYQQGQLMLDQLVSACYPLDEINTAIADVKQDKVLRAVICFGNHASLKNN